MTFKLCWRWKTVSSSMWMSSEQDPLCASANEESDSLANNAPFTRYEPNFFDDYHYSETTEIFLQEQSSDKETEPSYLSIARGPRTCMTRRSVTTLSAERSLHHCSLRSEKNQRAVDQSLSVCHGRTGRPVHELSSLGSSSREIPSRDSENVQIRILLERQKKQILADCRADIQKHEFQADYDRRSIQKLNEMIESQKRRNLSCSPRRRTTSTRSTTSSWTSVGIWIPASRKRSVWRKWKLTKKTVSSEEDRSLTWSTSTSGSQEPTIPSRIMPTSQLLFEMMIFRDSIRNGTKFYYPWRKSHLRTSWKDCTN